MHPNPPGPYRRLSSTWGISQFSVVFSCCHVYPYKLLLPCRFQISRLVFFRFYSTMKLALFSQLLCLLSTFALAVPVAAPVSEEFDLTETIRNTFEESLLPEELDVIHGTLFERREIEARDLEHTMENVIKIVNDSNVIFAILDQIAYYPNRIEKIANLTSGLVGKIDVSNVAKSVLNLHLSLNISGIYEGVMESGLISNVLDGVLLDKSYRPHLVNLVNRVLGATKNIFLWLVQDVFHKKLLNSKREDSGSKRSGLESFIGNIVSAALSSSLVADVSKDLVVALNDTGVATYVVQRFLADEGYQNFTAQLVLDIVKTGKVKSNGKSLNATGLVDKALSNPKLITGAVGSLLSGNINLSGLGKYGKALKDIVGDVEKNGTFVSLNKYVFSETHKVSTPLLPTDKTIVVPRTKGFSLTNLGGKKTSSTASSRKTSSPASSTSGGGLGFLTDDLSSITSRRTHGGSSSTGSADLDKSKSQAEVDSILSQLSVTTGRSGRSSSSLTGGGKSDTRDFNDIYASITAADGDSDDDSDNSGVNTDFSGFTSSDDTSSGSGSGGGFGNIVSLINAVSSSDGSSNKNNRELNFAADVGSSSSSSSSSKAASSKSDSGALSGSVSQWLIYLQVFLFGGILML